jgi:hypothetical protein
VSEVGPGDITKVDMATSESSMRIPAIMVSNDVYEVTYSDDECRAMLPDRFYLNDYSSSPQDGHISSC